MRHGLPYGARGQVVGILGGSFDPPHAGHVHITREALKRFGLDEVWWLVSPGNPLKDTGPASLERRMAAARGIMDHPKVKISDFEAHVGTRYTARTIMVLQAARPETRFVWLMGADNLAQFHKWKDWREIMARVPIGILARPGERIAGRTSKAAQVMRDARLHPRASHLLGASDAPAWCFVNLPMSTASSTAIRKAGAWSKAYGEMSQKV
ncbi:MAG: nicotinate-nucleotide adenylyltransferase [Shimia sp.]|uniref:nicotinate-nucleotide adenylyltransferase n=1 Tax=Shimia sp. TaxID=1954381 RepID=UPI004057F1D3